MKPEAKTHTFTRDLGKLEAVVAITLAKGVRNFVHTFYAVSGAQRGYHWDSNYGMQDLKRKSGGTEQSYHELIKRISIPDISDFHESDGLLFSPEGEYIFVPKGAYNLGEVNEKDGLLRANLTREGAELFVKTARDNHLTPYNGGLDVSKITSPEQRVSALGEVGRGLLLNGDDGDGGGDGFAFRERATK